MPASRFLKIVQETGQIPFCGFYLPVSTSRNHPVLVLKVAKRCVFFLGFDAKFESYNFDEFVFLPFLKDNTQVSLNRVLGQPPKRDFKESPPVPE